MSGHDRVQGLEQASKFLQAEITERKRETELVLERQARYPEYRARVRRHFEDIVRQQPSESELEFRPIRKNGSIIWVPEIIHRVTRPKHAATDWRILCRDITERKRAEIRMKRRHKDLEQLVKERTAALLEEKERAQVTLASIGDAVIRTDATGTIDYLNPAAERLTGWNNDEAQGMPLQRVFKVIDESTREPVEEAIERCLRENQVTGIGEDAVLVRRDGREVSISESSAPIRNRDGKVIGVVLVFSDVTEERDRARQLSYQASHDALTGLVNRHEFERRLERVLTTVQPNDEHSLLFLDLDQFKIVNDTCGHVAGDELLRQVAVLLQSKVRTRDTLARLGGDEFGVLLEHCPEEQTLRIANELRQTVQEFRFPWEGRGFNVGVSMGLVPIQAGHTLSTVLGAADSACYAAKDKGRNRIHVHRTEDTELLRRHGEMQWVTRIHRALTENRFRLYQQDIIAIGQDPTRAKYCEILIRLLDERGDLVLPGAFIPAAERYNQMLAIDRWVVNTALAALYTHASADPPVVCAINLSGQSLGDEKFLDFLTRQIDQSDIRPQQICFEITETGAVADLKSAVHFISTLKGQGCRFALDDFGTGLASFGYLKNLPVDYLKINGSFVRDMADDPIDCAMVESINQIGHLMGLKTIAESVQSEAILEKLKAMGVDYAQGYAIAKPRPLEAIN